MLNKKIIISFLTICILSSSIYAKQSDDERESQKRGYKHSNYHKDYSDKKIKSEKQKDIPPGLQKKVNNGGTLPPGW